MTEAGAGPDGIWTGRRGLVTLANLTIIAIAAFDALAVIAALPSIAEDLGDVALLPWVATAYLGASSVAVIVAGPVIDAVGVRRTFRFSGIWFIATSAGVAAAPTLELLLLARVLQGLGGGLVMAVAIASVGLAYPHHLRPRVFAANNAVWGIMGFGGPALAAAFLAIQGWRLIFVVQLPLTALALLIGWRALPSTRDRATALHVDFVGVGLLAVATFVIIGSLTEIASDAALAGVGLVAAVAVLATFWRHAGRHPDPIVARTHITRFPLGWAHLTVALALAAGLAADNYLPLYVQATRGTSEGFAAFSVVFLTVGWTVASFVFARGLTHRPESNSMLLGAATLLPGLAFAGLAIALDAPLPVIFTAFFVTGFSIGLVVTPGLTLIQASSAPEEMGRVNAAHQYLNTLGISIGIALGGAILLLVVDQQVGDVEAVRGVLSGDEVELGDSIRDAIGTGMVATIAAGGVLGAACLGAAARLRQRTRHGDRLATVR